MHGPAGRMSSSSCKDLGKVENLFNSSVHSFKRSFKAGGKCDFTQAENTICACARLGTEMKEVEIKNSGGLRLKTLRLLVCLGERGGRFHGKMRDNCCLKAAICASSARRLLTTPASSYETRCAAHCYSTLSSH